MILSIRHKTSYRYSQPVRFGDHRLCLRPRDNHLLRVEQFTVETTPGSRQRWMRDRHDNIVLVASFASEPADTLTFLCTAAVRVGDHNPFDFILDADAAAYPFFYQPELRSSLSCYLGRGRCGDALRVRDWFYGAVPYPVSHSDVVAFLSDLNAAIGRDIAYQRRDEEGIQSPDETLAQMRGSCRDMAVLFIETCRQLGLAARFVSGYMHDPPAAAGGAALNRAAGSTHAWAEVFLPGAGWKGFDPTNGMLANHFYIPCAVTDQPATVNPIQGSFTGPGAVQSQLEIDLVVDVD